MRKPPRSPPLRATIAMIAALPARPSRDAIAVEAPVNILFGGIPFAVMIATPADLEDFAVGFALTEGIIEALSDIRGVEIARAEQGLKVNVALAGERMSAHLARGRALAGRTGCGLCGIEELAHLPAPRAPHRRRRADRAGGRQGGVAGA